LAASCEQQRRLIDALLQLTIARCGLMRHEPVDIPATVGQALRACELRGFQTIVKLGPARTIGDPVLLERLAANLIYNAAQHNFTGGRIEVETRTDGERATLCIANTGRLIPAGELTRLFEPFRRLGPQPLARADEPGLGLGLAIVRAIADAHHASITPHTRPDGGLKLDVYFPATTKAAPPLS
jgi:signal transduction histidine kinase